MDWHASPTNTRWQPGPTSASSSRHCRPFVSWNSSTSTRSKRSRTAGADRLPFEQLAGALLEIVESSARSASLRARYASR